MTVPPLVSTSIPRKRQAREGSSRLDFFSRSPSLQRAFEMTAIALRHLDAEGQESMQSSTYQAMEHITPSPVLT